MNKRIAFIDFIKPVRIETVEIEAPLAFLFLSHAVRSAHFENRFFLFRQDASDEDALIQDILNFNPSILAFNGTFGVFAPDTVRLAGQIKNRLKDAVTIFGGISCTVSPRAYLEDPAVDYICLGEGEKAFAAFCQSIAAGSKPKEISGIYTLEDVGKRPFEVQVIDDLDEVDLDMDLIDWTMYTRKRGNTITVNALQSSRGCPFSCSFCYRSSVPCKYRIFPEEKLLKWVKRLQELVDFDYLAFIDDHFFVKKKHCYSLIEKIHGMGIKLTRLDIRMEDITDDLFRRVDQYEAGGLFVGLESPIDHVLARMNKRINRRLIDQAMEVIRRWPGVRVTAQLMLGIPGTTTREIFETIRFAVDRIKDTPNLYLGFVPYIPLPGTRFTDQILAHWPQYQMNTLEGIANLSTSARFNMEWTNLSSRMKKKMYNVRGLFFLYDAFYRQSKNPGYSRWLRICLRVYAAFLQKRLTLLILTGSKLEQKILSLIARRPVGYV